MISEKVLYVRFQNSAQIEGKEESQMYSSDSTDLSCDQIGLHVSGKKFENEYFIPWSNIRSIKIKKYDGQCEKTCKDANGGTAQDGGGHSEDAVRSSGCPAEHTKKPGIPKAKRSNR